MNFSYPTTMYKRISAKMYVFLLKKTLFTIFAEKIGMVGHSTSFLMHYFCMDSFSYIVCVYIDFILLKII